MSSADDLADLAERRAALDLSPDEFRRTGHALVDEIADFLASLPERRVTPGVGPRAIRARLPQGGCPDEGTDAARLVEETWRLLVESSTFNGHPRFFGYITSSAAPIGALADLMAASINANLGGWQLSPIATEIETQCVRWIAELLGVPHGCGLLVSGGNVANISAFLAARRAKGGDALRSRGVAAAARPLVAYGSAETHTWIQKAADLAGLGTDAIRWIPTDRDRRLDVAALRRRVATDVEQGARPFLIVGTAGTVATGAVDPLGDLADVAEEHDAWFHVDGAYGALARLVPDLTARFDGLERADSVAVDPHKWMYSPIEAGCLVVRHEDALRDTFSYTPTYYRFTAEDEDPRTNYYELGLQNTRGFRALKVWLGLRQVGRAGLAKLIGDDCRLSRELFRAVQQHDELEAVTHGLSITTFRHVPSELSGRGDEAVDEHQENLLARLKECGEAFVSNALVGGRFVLRACTCNFRTSLADVQALPEIVVRHGRELTVEAAGRPPAR